MRSKAAGSEGLAAFLAGGRLLLAQVSIVAWLLASSQLGARYGTQVRNPINQFALCVEAVLDAAQENPQFIADEGERGVHPAVNVRLSMKDFEARWREQRPNEHPSSHPCFGLE
jgi:hypothetical protein